MSTFIIVHDADSINDIEKYINIDKIIEIFKDGIYTKLIYDININDDYGVIRVSETIDEIIKQIKMGEK